MANNEKPKTADLIAGLPHDRDGYVGDGTVTLDLTGGMATVSLTGESMAHPRTVSELGNTGLQFVHEDKLALGVGTTKEGDEVRVLMHSDKPELPVSAEIRVRAD